MLRHGENASWVPERDKVGAISAELAFNVGILCGKMYKEQSPSDLYGFCILEQKDINRPRFHVLVREPSRTELNDVSARKYMIIGGPLNGKLLLRIRSVQGHSGARAQHMTRINHKFVPNVEFPTLLMHSTKISLLESIGRHGLMPGGLTRGRVDVFMSNAEDFAHSVYFDKIYAPLVWKDPVRDVHMRVSSDVVLFIPGALLSQEDDFVLWQSLDTGDYMTPCTIPANCLITGRRRDNGDIEHVLPEQVHKSALIENPACYWFATGKEADQHGKNKAPIPPLPPPVAEPSPSPVRASERARGSTDPMTPRDDCSRATGAGTPKVILKEAPRNKTELPPVPPERVAEHNLKQESKNKIPTSESKDEPEEEEPFQPCNG